MRILVFNWRDITHPLVGGATWYIHEQAKRWVKAGYEVTLFCAQHKGAARSEKIDEGVDIVRRGGRFTVYLWACIYYLLRFRNKYDVVVDSDNGIPFFTPLYCCKPKVCVVYHVHREQFKMEFTFPLSWIGIFLECKLVPWLYRNVRIITISPSTLTKLGEIGFTRDNCEIVFSGVDASVFRSLEVEKTERPSIVYLGRFKAYKRLDILLRLGRDLLERIPDLELHLAGPGDDRALKNLAKSLGLEKHIQFYGYISQQHKIKLLNQAWLFVTPSMNEGWGITVIEANACGTPVVAFGVPGLRDSICDGYSGLLADNPQDMFRKILLILTDERFREKLSCNAMEWANQFSWDTSAQKTLGILRRVVGNDSSIS